MIVYITDETLTEIGMIDHGSVIWTQKYNDLGEFEITVPATLELLNLFRSGVFALREESESVMMIEKIQTKTNPESGDYIVVTGRSAEALLNRRIVWEQTNIDTDIGAAVRLLIEQNVTDATDTSRNVPLLNIGTIEAAGQTTQRQLRGECIYDTVKEMMDLAKMGFRVRRYGRALYMDLYHGKKTEVIFSWEFDNLSQMEYTADNTDFRNTVLVVGEGEGTAQKTTAICAGATLNRCEMYLDKSSSSTNEGTITDEEYQKTLQGEGTTALAEKKTAETVTVEVDTDGIFRYGIDFTLGDIVTVIDPYGDKVAVRVSQITENNDENGNNFVLSCEKI